MADVLKKNRIKNQYDGYVAAWAFVSDLDGHLWISEEALERMNSVYDGYSINIHVYGKIGNLTADITNSAESFDVCEFDSADFVLIDNIIDLEVL